MPGLLIALPTADRRVVPETVLACVSAAALLDRAPNLLRATTTGVSRVRNDILDMVRRRNPDAERARVLWVDSDIVVDAEFAPALADAIRAAEAGGFSWACNYPQADGRSVLIGRDGRYLTDQDLLEAPDWMPIGACGFGFCYLDMPLGYRFHEGPEGSEDVNWARETRPDLRLCRTIRAGHLKTQLLLGPDTWTVREMHK